MPPNKRDPRVDPKAGDVLRTTSNEDYRVVAIDGGFVLDMPIDPAHPDFGPYPLRNTLSAWRGFMYGAEVIHAAD